MAEDFAIGKALVIPQDVLNNITKLDEKINLIASDSEKMATHFQSAMTRMGNDASKFLEKLNAIQGKIESLGISGFPQGVFNIGKGVEQIQEFSSSIIKAAEAINKYNNAQGKSDSSKRISELNEEIEALKKKTEQLQKVINAQNKSNSSQSSTRAENKAIDAYNRAMASSEALVTQRINKIAKLRQAEEMLSAQGSKYEAQIKRINSEIERLNKLNNGQVDAYGRIKRSQSSLMNTSDQLMRKLALIFSVSQIQGYIEKLVKVRGEFELQNTALASILQNKEEADILFGQITELAVNSPFTVKELVTYTKSLSAYQVEYEKLYDTTKMLADVAAGLGVDMQRLILAFGQVKAANFLRGTETRQFTEAGINMLGELAKYYSELEGRIVSVSEVQDRQFKKMISFQDVEEVFKRLTSAGGMFYNMQEKQADTLAGQVSNLQDSIDIMLNDIGTENQGILSGIISGVKAIIENWETVVRVIEPLSASLLTYLTLTKGISLASKGVGNAFLNIGVALEQVKLSLTAAGRAQAGFNSAVAANGYIMIGAAIIATILAIKNAIEAAREEQEKLNKIASDGYYNAISSSANYERLANVVASSTASYQEQKEALEELNRTYSDILPQHYLEAEAIREMKGNYDEATAAIQNYIRAKTQEKQLQYISEEYGEKLQEAQDYAAKGIQAQIEGVYDYKIALSEVNTVLLQLRKEFEEGGIGDIGEAKDRLNELLSMRTGMAIDIDFKKEGWGEISDYAQAYFDSLVQMKNKTDEVINSSSMEWADKITLELQEQRKQLDEQIKEANSLLDMIAAKYSGSAGSELITDKQISDAKVRLTELGNAWDFPIEKIQQLKGGAYEISEISKQIKVSALKSFANQIASMRVPTTQLASSRMFLQGVRQEIDALNPTPLQNFVSEIILSTAKLNNVSLDGLVDAFAKAGEQIPDYTKRIKGMIDNLTEQLNTYSISPYLVGWSGQDAQDKEKMRKVLQTVYNSFNKTTEKSTRKTSSGKKQNSELDRLREMIELIKKAADEYKKLIELYDEGTATSKTRSFFKGDYSAMKMNIDVDFDTEGVLRQINSLTNKAGKEGRKLIEEETRNLKTELDISVREESLDKLSEEIEGIFSDYEFSLELENEGIDNSFIKSLFNIDTTDIETAVQKVNEKVINAANEMEKKSAESEKRAPRIFTEVEEAAKSLGEKGYEEYKKYEDKISEYQEKALTERLKKYAKYVNESISKRANAEIELQKEIQRINNTKGLTSEQKNLLVSKKKDETSKEVAKIEWEDFKSSDVYVKLFDDLEYVSDAALNRIKEKLDEMKKSLSDLDPEQLKSIQEYYNKITEQLIERNPFSEMRKAMKDVNKLLGEGKTEDFLQQQLISYDNQAETLKSQISDLEIIIGLKQNGLSLDSQTGQFLERNKDYLDETVESLSSILVNKKSELDSVNKSIGITDKDLNSFSNARKALSSLSDEINNAVSLSKNAFGSITTILESMGSGASLTENTFAEMGVSLLDLSAQAAQFALQLKLATVQAEAMGVAINSSMGVIGWIVIALQTIATIFSAIAGANDEKKEKEIQRLIDLVDQLEKSYDKLYDTIENGLSTNIYTMNSALIKNLQKQVENYRAMISAEYDKKDPDDDRIKDWKDSIDDIYEQIDELYRDIKTKLVGDFRDISDQLGDAMADAFKNGEDAASAWGETVNEIISDIVQNLMVQKFIEPKVQEILDEIYKAALPNTSESEKIAEELAEAEEAYSNFGKTPVTLSNLKERFAKYLEYAEKLEELRKKYEESLTAAEGEMPNITQSMVDEALDSLKALGEDFKNNPIWDMLKELYSGMDTDSMSGLQKGISSVTEETAQVLESLLNSMRFYVADTNADIKNIYNFLTNTPVESPLMQELKAQTEQLRIMSSLWSSLSMTKPGVSGKCLKVNIV